MTVSISGSTIGDRALILCAAASTLFYSYVHTCDDTRTSVVEIGRGAIEHCSYARCRTGIDPASRPSAVGQRSHEGPALPQGRRGDHIKVNAHPRRHVVILVCERRTRYIGPERLHDELPNIVEVYKCRFDMSSAIPSGDGGRRAEDGTECDGELNAPFDSICRPA